MNESKATSVTLALIALVFFATALHSLIGGRRPLEWGFFLAFSILLSWLSYKLFTDINWAASPTRAAVIAAALRGETERPFFFAAILSFIEWAMVIGALILGVFLLIGQFASAHGSPRNPLLDLVSGISVGYGFVGFFCTRPRQPINRTREFAVFIVGVTASVLSVSIIWSLTGASSSIASSLGGAASYVGIPCVWLIAWAQLGEHEWHRLSIFRLLKGLHAAGHL